MSIRVRFRKYVFDYSFNEISLNAWFMYRDVLYLKISDTSVYSTESCKVSTVTVEDFCGCKEIKNENIQIAIV